MVDFSSTSLLFWNLLIFIVFQSLFFYFISSAFLFEVIDSKIKAIGKFAINGLDDSQLEILKGSLIQKLEEVHDEAMDAEARRAENNKDFLIEKIGYDWVGWVSTLFIISLSGLVLSGSFSKFNIMLMTAVIIAYLTEIWLFFFMMKPYEYIGTYEIIKYVNDRLEPRLPNYTVKDIIAKV